jgi:hypothetical protein
MQGSAGKLATAMMPSTAGKTAIAGTPSTAGMKATAEKPTKSGDANKVGTQQWLEHQELKGRQQQQKC